jgi:hypothetical protein
MASAEQFRENPEGLETPFLHIVSNELFRAEAALEMIDDHIQDVYLPQRGQRGYGTERAIFVEPPHVPHRENNAEHSYHVADIAVILYENRKELSMPFPEDFDSGKMAIGLIRHDGPEVKTGDIDATCQDQSLRINKKENELAAIRRWAVEKPYLAAACKVMVGFVNEDCYEYQFGSDIEKIAATRVIALDGGKKWWGWGHESTTMQRMFETYRPKIITPVGRLIWKALEADLETKPHLFPEFEYVQDRLFVHPVQ